MSYQTYVDNLVGHECVMGGLYDVNAGTAWHDASAANSCKATPEEIKTLKAGIIKGSFNPDFPPTIEGVKYTTINVDKDSEFPSATIKSKHENKDDRQLVMVVICKKFIMIGAMKGSGERKVIGVVQTLAEYLDKNI